MKYEENCFLCPECGGNVPGVVMMVSPVLGQDNPVSHVLEWISCEECGSNIPAHIAERWENQSIDEARKEWREIYKDNQLDD